MGKEITYPSNEDKDRFDLLDGAEVEQDYTFKRVVNFWHLYGPPPKDTPLPAYEIPIGEFETLRQVADAIDHHMRLMACDPRWPGA